VPNGGRFIAKLEIGRAGQQSLHIADNDSKTQEFVARIVAPMGLIVHSHGSAEEFLAGYDDRQGGCLVLGTRLPGMSALELLAHLRHRRIRLPTIVLTASADVALAVRAMQNGALTVLQRPCRDQQLADAVREALLVDLHTCKRARKLRSKLDSLSAGERHLLDLILQGKTNKAISQNLSIALRTVEARRHSLMAKLHASSLVELIRTAMEARLLLGADIFDDPPASSDSGPSDLNG
jgi:FixJ family two-component response regulator